MTEPFRLRRPRDADRVPVVYDSPHSGRYYPPDFETTLPRTDLRRAEDAYVDELLEGALAYGIAVLDAKYPRSYIDLNRAATDIDPELLSEPWPTPVVPTEKSTRGLGLIRRLVAPGVAINARPLSPAEVQARIDNVYLPYHSALDDLIESTRAKFGVVWHINWHSMKSKGHAMTPDGDVMRRIDAIVSDADGRTASPDVTRFVAYTLRGLGMRVAVNDPYKGGNIVRRIGAPSRCVHSVQVELNRALYLDEHAVTKTPGLVALGRLIEVASRELGVVAAMQAH
jgi:N-formylglutamate deformylase